MFNKKRLIFAMTCALLVGMLMLGAFIWRKAQRTLEETEKQVTSASLIPFAINPVTRAASTASLPAFDVRGNFKAFASFEGDWFVCNSSTLFRYDSQGQLHQTWRVGFDLPASPLVGLAVRRGIPQAELWVATDGAGTLIWDSHTFRQFMPQTTKLRKETAMLPLSTGKVLLGTRNSGLYVTDTQQLAVFRPELRDAEVTALARGATSEEVWIGTRNQGVWLWRAGTLSHFVSELPDAQVLSIFADDNGVWVGTANGVAEFIDGQFRRRFAEGVLATALAENAGTLWISTIDEGTLTVDLKAHTPRRSLGATLRSRDTFQSVALMPVMDGIVALGDANIRRFPDGADVLSPNLIGLTNGHITALNVDSQHRLWIGYFDRGLDLLPAQSGAVVQHLENDVLFCVNRIKGDPAENRTLVATANGLVLFDMSGRPRQVLRAGDGLISNHVTDMLTIATERGGESTVIATNAGLTFINGATVSSVYAFQGLVNNHVYTLTQTGTVLLAGTLGGVSILKNSLVQNSFTTANSNLSQNWITGSVSVGDDIYLGTYGSGVVMMNSRFDVESFREFTNARIEINANAMITTKRGVYAGTAGQGLAFLPAGEQRWHFWKNGLPSENVTALAADEGNLFIGTDNGLVRISERDLIQ